MRQVILNECVEMQKKFAELNNQGLIGLYDWVHLRLEEFLDCFDKYKVRRRDDDEMPYELSAIYKDVNFIAVVWKDEVEKYGIQIPTEEV